MSKIKGTTKNKGQKDSLDRFYTSIPEANRLTKLFLATLLELDIENTVFVEPSAGDGAFVLALEDNGISHENILALDVLPSDEPQCSTKIHQHDFLRDDFEEKICYLAEQEKLSLSAHSFVFIGNPPFGEQCRTAIEFVNRSLELGRYCAFILPRSFHKETIQKKINGRVIHTFQLDDINYRVGDAHISVPSSFFIFDGEQDFIPLPDKSCDLPFDRIPISKRERADFAIRRIGGAAGRATDEDLDELSSETYYFYVQHENCLSNIVDIINTCDFPEREWSVGPRSLSSKEISKNIYDKFLELGLISSDDVS